MSRFLRPGHQTRVVHVLHVQGHSLSWSGPQPTSEPPRKLQCIPGSSALRPFLPVAGAPPASHPHPGGLASLAAPSSPACSPWAQRGHGSPATRGSPEGPAPQGLRTPGAPKSQLLCPGVGGGDTLPDPWDGPKPSSVFSCLRAKAHVSEDNEATFFSPGPGCWPKPEMLAEASGSCPHELQLSPSGWSPEAGPHRARGSSAPLLTSSVDGIVPLVGRRVGGLPVCTAAGRLSPHVHKSQALLGARTQERFRARGNLFPGFPTVSASPLAAPHPLPCPCCRCVRLTGRSVHFARMAKSPQGRTWVPEKPAEQGHCGQDGLSRLLAWLPEAVIPPQGREEASPESHNSDEPRIRWLWGLD